MWGGGGAFQAASEVTPSERVMAKPRPGDALYGVATEFSFFLRHRSRCEEKDGPPAGTPHPTPQQGARLFQAETLC